jgi:hypothetical protein
LVDLLQKQVITTYGSDYKIVNLPNYSNGQEDNPLLTGLKRNFNTDDFFTYNEGLNIMECEAVLHQDLEQLYELSKKVDYQKLIIPGIVLLIGFARFLQGIANERPVGLLVFEMGAFALACLAMLALYSYTKSVRQHLGLYWQQQNADGFGNNVLNNFTILGSAAIAGFAEYAMLKNIFDSYSSEGKKNGDGSSGCGSSGCSGGGGSSCGGSSCGGSGCGGCGGGD